MIVSVLIPKTPLGNQCYPGACNGGYVAKHMGDGVLAYFDIRRPTSMMRNARSMLALLSSKPCQIQTGVTRAALHVLLQRSSLRDNAAARSIMIGGR